MAKLWAGGAVHLSGPPAPLVEAAVQRHLHRPRRPSHRRLEHLQVLKIAFSLRSFLRFAELETCFTEQLLPEAPVGVNNVTELMSNQSMNMTNLTSLTTNQEANLTSLVVMVPRVCPTALRKSHWYTRYEFLHIPFSLCFTLSNSKNSVRNWLPVKVFRRPSIFLKDHVQKQGGPEFKTVDGEVVHSRVLQTLLRNLVFRSSFHLNEPPPWNLRHNTRYPYRSVGRRSFEG